MEKRGTYKRYSKDEELRAKNTDMISFLEKRYGWSFKKTGREYHGIEHNSFVVKSDRKTWYWNSQSCGGVNVLDFLSKIEHITSYREQLEIILGEPLYTEAPVYVAPAKEEGPTRVALPSKEKGQWKKAFAYLHKSRGISKNVIQSLMKDGKVYQAKSSEIQKAKCIMRHEKPITSIKSESDVSNVVFVNYNEKGQAAFWTVNGTVPGSHYKQNAPGSNHENYGFWMESRVTNANNVYVFEAPIDALSHATLSNIQFRNPQAWKFDNRVALCGTSDRALTQFLEKHKEIHTIILCLDRDEGGRKATEKLTETFSAKGYMVCNLPPREGCKDYNDELMAYYETHKKKEARVSESHER